MRQVNVRPWATSGEGQRLSVAIGINRHDNFVLWMVNRQDAFRSKFFLKTGDGIYLLWAPQPCSVGPEQISQRFGVLSQIRAERHKLVYHAKEASQFCDITWLRNVDNGLNFGRIVSNSFPINNLSKVLKPGNREYTVFIV